MLLLSYQKIFILIFSYFIGSLNFSILISKFYFKKEIVSLGSKNAGTTNMLRVFGKKFAVLTFLGDFSKGLFSVFFVKLIVPKITKLTFDDSVFFNNFIVDFQMFALIGVVLGHIFPIFFKFKGGKGIATTAGAIFLIDYKIFIAIVVLFLIILLKFKIVSLSSIITIIFYVFLNAIYFFINYKINSFDFSIVSFQVWFSITLKSTLLGFIILFKHAENIKRLINKTEPKIGW